MVEKCVLHTYIYVYTEHKRTRSLRRWPDKQVFRGYCCTIPHAMCTRRLCCSVTHTRMYVHTHTHIHAQSLIYTHTFVILSLAQQLLWSVCFNLPKEKKSSSRNLEFLLWKMCVCACVCVFVYEEECVCVICVYISRAKNSSTSAKEPSISANEPSISAKEPSVHKKSSLVDVHTGVCINTNHAQHILRNGYTHT